MWKAWVINSIILGLISAFTIEIRRILDEHQFISMLPDIPHKFVATILISSTAGFVAYTVVTNNIWHRRRINGTC